MKSKIQPLPSAIAEIVKNGSSVALGLQNGADDPFRCRTNRAAEEA